MAYDAINFPNNQLAVANVLPAGTTVGGALYFDPAPTTTTAAGTLTLSQFGVPLPAENFTGFTVTHTGTTYALTSMTNALSQRIVITYNTATPNIVPSILVQQNLPLVGFQTIASGTNFVVSSTVNVPCFAAGTLIRTSRGEVAVEDLLVGDRVETTSGKSRSIVWLGNSDIDIRLMAHPTAYQPVRIAADAFGSGMPHSDLTLSPGHGICVRMLDEVIVPPIVLVNGTTINQLDVDHVSYWHVELESHDIMYANGLPAESYINVGNRVFFEAPGDDPVRTLADYCRPYVAEGVLVQGMREQLRLRAEQLGWRCDTSPFADLHLEADGARIEPAIDGLNARFDLPAAAQEVWLVSAASVPAHVLGSHDTRRLGVLLQSLRIDDKMIALDDASLCVGFHPAEAAGDGVQRWTTGRARLPASLWQGAQGALAIGIELAAPPLPKWMAPAQAEAKPLRDGKHLSLVAA